MKKRGINASLTIKNPRDLKRIAARLKDYNYPAYILWTIGLNTGYRGGDLVKLTVADLKEAVKSKELVVLEEKTENTRKIKFQRTAALNDKIISILEEYIKNKDDAEYVYWTKRTSGKAPYKNHIRRDSLGKIFRRVIIELGIADNSIGTHTPRKTYGYIQYISHDKDINYVQELFGHSSTKVTKAYIGLDEDISKESSDIMRDYTF